MGELIRFSKPQPSYLFSILLGAQILTAVLLPFHVALASEDDNSLALDSASSAGGTIGAASSGPAYGDFNGDGKDDLALGVPGEAVGTGDSITFAGAVNVLYGSSTGLQASGTGGPNDQFWTQDSPGVLDTAEEFDRFGWTLAVGDFNGDGRDDLAVGSPFESTGMLDHIGAVNILYGSATGLQSGNDQFWTQDSSGILNEGEQEDFFGFSLAVGNFNGDGFDDLGVGIPGEDLNEGVSLIMDGGAVAILFGSANGLTATGDQIWNQNSPSVFDDAEEFDSFGRSVVAADFNNDGRDDLVIGVPFESVGAVSVAGAANVLYGSSTGLQSSGTGGPNDQFWNQNSAGVLDSAEANDNFGSSLATGDFNNDGRDDLGVGVPFENIGSIQDAGAANVLYGSSTGLQSGNDQFWNQDSSSVQDTAEAFDNFANALAGGDFNNDGRDDLAIGVQAEDLGGIEAVGAVNVLYGSSTGLQASGTGGPDDQFWNQDSTGVLDTAEANDQFGFALGAADFNGDDRDDLAVGIPSEAIGTIFGAGAANVLYGSATGLQTSNDQFWNQDSSGVLGSADDSDNFGWALGS